MGLQINIKTRDMLAAGWTVRTEFSDHEPYLVFSRNDVELHSYSPYSFCADCNAWGNNKALFNELGLLGLPHILA